jgi:cation/acetate symporter
MKGITYTQVAQYCVMVFAYTIQCSSLSLIITGNAIPQFGLVGDYVKDGAGECRSPD